MLPYIITAVVSIIIRRQDGMTRGSVPDMAGYQSEDFCKS